MISHSSDRDEEVEDGDVDSRGAWIWRVKVWM